MSNKKKSVAVVGGGLVGSLEATFLARRGFEVHLYEYRDDIRTLKHVQGKSINLAMAERGRAALRAIGIEDRIVEKGIPMHGRMVHDHDGIVHFLPYGKEGQYNLSMDRRALNEALLNEAQTYNNVHFHFKHRLISCDPESGTMKFERPDGLIKQFKADVIIGCDGAHSNVRTSLLKRQQFNYSQEYIPHAYKELCLRPVNGEFAMKANYLHIWPRGKFMLIALPNLDKTFTCTMFMPYEVFNGIQSDEGCIEFFRENFPDFLQLMGKENLLKDYFQLDPLPLIQVKCHPYNVNGSLLIMGDAAHAMVPFHGSGMNTGFEDCLLLDEVMEKCDNNFDVALPEYTRIRNVDAKAICDLSMRNYLEMRDHVNHAWYVRRKKIDKFLNKLFPSAWVPLYSMVMYTRIRFSEVAERKIWQDQVLRNVRNLSLLAVTTIAGFILWSNRKVIHEFLLDLHFFGS